MLSLSHRTNEMFLRGRRDRNARHKLALGVLICQAGPSRPVQGLLNDR